MSVAVVDDVAAQADQLLALWNSLSMRHVALGGACACGTGGLNLRLEDFELDIVDHLHDAAAHCEEPAVAAWGQAALRAVAEVGEVQRLAGLLADVQHPRAPPEVAEWLLPRLARMLHSYAELHGGGALR